MEQVKASPQQEQRLCMGYEEFLAWADEDVHAEWVDGKAIVHMPPKRRHQAVVNFLETLLTAFVRFFRLGVVLSASFEIKLWPGGPAREPDILFVAEESRERLTEERLVGPADLIVEVISDDSVARDRSDNISYQYQARKGRIWPLCQAAMIRVLKG